MFNFDKTIFSHMPFVAYGSSPEFKAEQFCCLKVGGKFKRSANEISVQTERPEGRDAPKEASQWKLHHFDGETWKRINTGLSEEATECSPTAELIDGKWQVSFVAGGAEPDRKFRLYKIADLGNPQSEVVCEAEVGFLWKNRIVFGKRSGGLYVSDASKTQKLTFANVEYLYRVSYNPSNPNELLISGQYNSGELFSWACNVNARTLHSLCVNGKPAYKAAFFGNILYYAERGNSDGFEERHIASSESYEKTPLSFDEVVSVETEKPAQGNIELLKHFTNATIRFAKSGFKIVDTETLAVRKAICYKCEFWDSSAFFGRGKCRKCGCSSAKLHLTSEKCPIGKWRFCL